MNQIFINLPVTDTEKSMSFYQQLGFTVNSIFTDEYQKCMVWTEQIYVMLIAKERFVTYSQRASVNEGHCLDAYFTLKVGSIEKVNEMVENGLKAGGTEPVSMVDEGFMQIRKIVDFDGHAWDIIFLDVDKFQAR